jgi:hypothetical protein
MHRRETFGQYGLAVPCWNSQTDEIETDEMMR